MESGNGSTITLVDVQMQSFPIQTPRVRVGRNAATSAYEVFAMLLLRQHSFSRDASETNLARELFVSSLKDAENVWHFVGFEMLRNIRD